MGLRRLRLARAPGPIGLALGLALAVAAQGLADPRRTVCSVTLHSEDEIATLRAGLPENEFRFVELTELVPAGSEAPAGSGARSTEGERSEDDWLGAACESGIRCDVLVVSGHFGGSFFGASGRTLQLADLETHACRNDCPGVLGHPTEVFLLGCNTAASKARDHRSPEEYLRALREDGISRRSAERIVESRYGSLGNSFRARMERVFAGVPHVYGFGSVAPAGPTAAIALERYLSRIGSYGTHLERMSREVSSGYGTDLERMSREVSSGQSRGAEPVPNRALARALGHTTFVEFTGMSSDGEAAARRELVCSLYDDTRPAEERLGVVEAMTTDPAFLSYVPSIERFFDTHPRWSFQGPLAEASLGRLEGMARPRGELLQRLDALGAPTLRSKLAGVAASLGWIDEVRHQRIAREAVVELFDRNMGLEEQKAICALAPELGDADLHEDELDPGIFRDSTGNKLDPTGSRRAARYAARALLCVEPREPALRARMAVALDDERWGVRARALETLARLGVDDPDVWAAAARMLANDPRTEVRAEAARTLAERRPIGVAALSGALSDPEPAVRAVAARGLGGLGDYPGVAAGLARALADGDWQVQFAAASALDQIAQSPAGFEDAGVSAEIERALEQALDAPSWFVRYKVAETLARIRTAGAEVAGAEAGHSEG